MQLTNHQSNYLASLRYDNDYFIYHIGNDIDFGLQQPKLSNLCLSLDKRQYRILLDKLSNYDQIEVYAQEIKCSNHEYYLALKVRF